MAEPQAIQIRGPPYASATAGIGGVPDPAVDIPATAVFLALYITFAVANMTILQVNLRRKHKFLISGALFGFCMARTVTCIMRIAWATRQHNVRLAMAANIFTNAGILLVYIVNLLLAQRILRAKQPQLGWNAAIRTGFKALYALIGIALACVITSIVLSAYTLNMHIHQICRDIQLAAITYLFVFSILPWILLALAYFPPKNIDQEHFGYSRMRYKAAIVLASSTLCATISGFKCGTAWMPPHAAKDPYWFDSKACFYIFNFSLEIIILSLLVSTRIDKRFHVPDGSQGPGDYISGYLTPSDHSQNGDIEIVKA